MTPKTITVALGCLLEVKGPGESRVYKPAQGRWVSGAQKPISKQAILYFKNKVENERKRHLMSTCGLPMQCTHMHTSTTIQHTVLREATLRVIKEGNKSDVTSDRED